MVNCQRMQTQVKNVVPSIAVDKTDGCVIYLSFASRSSQIVTSKCSEVNVSFPNSDSDDADWVRGRAEGQALRARWMQLRDLTTVSCVCLFALPEWQIELPIPEQFVTVLRGDKLATTVSDLYSS